MVNSIEETTMVTVSGQTHYPLELLSKCRMVKTEVRLVLVSLSGVVSQMGCFLQKIEFCAVSAQFGTQYKYGFGVREGLTFSIFWRENSGSDAGARQEAMTALLAGAPSGLSLLLSLFDLLGLKRDNKRDNFNYTQYHRTISITRNSTQ